MVAGKSCSRSPTVPAAAKGRCTSTTMAMANTLADGVTVSNRTQPSVPWGCVHARKAVVNMQSMYMMYGSPCFTIC